MRVPGLRLAIACLLGALVWPGAPLAVAQAGEEEVFRDDSRLPAFIADLPREDWFGIYGPGGMKLGWTVTRIKTVETPDGLEVELASDLLMNLSGADKDVSSRLVEHFRFEARPPWRFLRGGNQEEQAASRKTIEVTNAEKLLTRITEDGRAREWEDPAVSFTLADHLVMEAWLAPGQAKPGDAIRAWSFDLGDRKAVLDRMTLKTLSQTLDPGLREIALKPDEAPFYLVELESGDKGKLGELWLNKNGGLLNYRFGGLFEVRRESREQAQAAGTRGDIFAALKAPLDQPLKKPRKVKRLRLEATGAGAAHLANGPRQEVRREAGKTILVLGDGVGERPAVTPAEREECLAETEDYPLRDPDVVALLNQALGSAKSDREKAHKLVKFVSEFIQDSYRHQPLTVRDILRERKGDCSEHAVLFCTLARAAGLPAREVSGLFYGASEQGFVPHAWNEVAIDGRWTPVDPTWNQTVTDGTHIRFGDLKTAPGVAAEILGQIAFKLLEVED